MRLITEPVVGKRGLTAFSGQHVLLLQGPLGPFFRRLSRDLVASGARVSKINFNGGDWLFYPTGATPYKGRMDEWPGFLARFLREEQVDVVLMYGDCRPIHECVRKETEQAGVELGVFEAGYVRPNYITLEHSGINDYSSVPRTPDYYLRLSAKKTNIPDVVGSVFWHAALWAILYYVASSLLRPIFRHYQHHRRLAMREALPWLRGLWRKYYFHLKERKVRRQLQTMYSGRFFLVPLQVHHDSQMHIHSDYASVDTFIQYVVSDFAKYAEADKCLVIKHHPMDRGYRDYTRLCKALGEIYHVEGRLFYMHDIHLPTFFKHACGVVVVNSTVGLSALLQGLPVKVCGRSIYDISGLTFRGVLSDFWKAAASSKPNPKVLMGFRYFLIERTQLNGSVYRRLSTAAFRTGVVWSGTLSFLTVLARQNKRIQAIRFQRKAPAVSNASLGLSVVRYEAVKQAQMRRG
jgi:capsular polysaccharide export protein